MSMQEGFMPQMPDTKDMKDMSEPVTQQEIYGDENKNPKDYKNMDQEVTPEEHEEEPESEKPVDKNKKDKETSSLEDLVQSKQVTGEEDSKPNNLKKEDLPPETDSVSANQIENVTDEGDGRRVSFYKQGGETYVFVDSDDFDLTNKPSSKKIAYNKRFDAGIPNSGIEITTFTFKVSKDETPPPLVDGDQVFRRVFKLTPTLNL